jgi:hypothetical protein
MSARKTKKPSAFLGLACAAVLGLLAGLGAPRASRGEDVAFLRGDANLDGRVSISDGIMIRRFLFNGQWPPDCLETMDVDDGDVINIVDYIKILTAFFPNDPGEWGTHEIAQPYPEPGLDAVEDTTSCPDYTVEAPQETDDIIRIGSVEAAPGEEVEIPVFITNSLDIDAIQMVVEYDPALFTPIEDWADGGINYEDTAVGAILDSMGTHQFCFSSLQAHPEDGIFTVGIVPSMIHIGHELQPGIDTLVAKLRGVVSPEAQPGTVIVLEPTNGPDGGGVKPPLLMKNELTHHGDARFVTLFPQTVPGHMAIVDDITFFIRGDSNGDGVTNLSDAVHILGFLFLGGPAPSCRDASDADDSGVIELTDAVVILRTLFLGDSTIAPPYPAPGGDPGPDAFPRCRR